MQIPINHLPVDIGAEQHTPFQEMEGITQKTDYFGPDGLKAMGAGFMRENLIAKTIEWVRGTGVSGNVDQALQDYRAIAGWSENHEERNPFEDPRVLAAPRHYWSTLAQAETTEEVSIILDVLRNYEMDVQTNISEAGGSYLMGAGAGALLNPSGLMALNATRFAQLPRIATTLAAEETALGGMDPTRSFQEQKTNMLFGTASIGGFIAVQKAISAMSALMPNKITQAYAESAEINAKNYREYGPWGQRVDGLDEDGLPFGATDVQPQGASLRINPEDELDIFDPIKQSGVDVKPTSPESNFVPPSMGTAESERMVNAAFLEVVPDNPVKRTLQQTVSSYARGLVSHLVEHPFYQMKNLGNSPTSIGVDRLIQQKWMGQGFVPAMRQTEDLYATYRQRMAGDAQKSMFRQNVVDTIKRNRPEDVLSPTEFLEQATLAKMHMRDPAALAKFPDEVIQTAKIWDDLVYSKLGQAAKEMRMFSIREVRQLARLRRQLKAVKENPPKGKGPQEAAEEIEKIQVQIKELEETIKRLDELDIKPEFVNRLYRHDTMNTPEGRAHWIQVLSKHGYSAKDADLIRQKILNELPYPDINADPVGLARSMKERTLADVPDVDLAPFLEKNILALGRYYALRMGSDVELMRKFGSVDMLPHIRNISKEFDIKIKAAKTQEEINALTKQKFQTIDDIETIRDRVRGTYGMPDNPDMWSERGMRIAKMWNATSALTGALAAVPDLGHIIMREGMSRSFRASFEALSNNMQAIRLAHQEANLAGEALDMYMSMRAAMFADLGDSLSVRNKFERVLGAGTQAFFNINLMNQWNTAAKTLTSLIAGSRLIEDAILTSTRRSGLATIRYGTPRAKADPSRIIAASYNRKLNRVTVNKEAMRSAYEKGAWKNSRIEGVEPLDDALFKSYDDFERFVMHHELAHADFARTASETLGQYENRINRIALRRMTLANKSDENAAVRLRKAGISEDMARRIADESEAWGHWGQHVRIARSHLWTDQEAAQVYRSALGKEINTTIVTPGKGDLPNFMGGGFGKIIPENVQAGIRETVDKLPEGAAKEAVQKAGGIFMSPTMSQLVMQFKSFGISAQHRMITPALQQFNGNVLIGAAALVGLGFMVDKIRREQGGYPAGSFDDQLGRAIERSGLMGYVTDIMRAAENMQNPISSPGKVLETLGGPIVHQIDDLTDVMWDYGRLNVGSRTNATLVDVLPLSNVAHLKWLADAQHHSLNVLTGVE